MTITSTVSRNNYTGDGAQLPFAITFEFKALTDIEVRTFDTGTSIESLVLAGIVISGVAKADGTGFSSGTVTFAVAPTATTEITIRNTAADAQSQTFTEGGGFPAKNAEGAYDRIVLLVQQLKEQINRAVKYRITSRESGPTLPDGVVGKFLQWGSATTLINADGTATTGGATTVAVSANDSTPGVLNGKLVGGTGITLVEGNDGANETLTIDASATPATSSPFEVADVDSEATIRGFRNEAASTGQDLADYDGDGQNQAASQVVYARARVRQTAMTTGAETGIWQWFTRVAGVMSATRARMTLALGLTVDDPLQATALVDPAAGFINCRGLQINNVAFESSATTPQQTAVTTNGIALDAMTTGRQFAAFGTVSSVLHVLGGEDSGSTLLASVESLDPSQAPASQWTTGTPAATAFTEAASAVDANVVYAFGGRTGAANPVLTNRSYTPGTDTWDETLSTAATWTARKKATGATVASGSAIFVMGGVLTSGASDAATNQVRVYNPTTDAWSSGTNLPANRQGGVAAVLGDGKLYYFGGGSTNNTNSAQSTVFVYDSVLDQWETAGVSMPYPLVHASMSVIGGYAVIAGGITPSGGVARDVWFFDPFTQTFTLMGLLAVKRSVFAMGLGAAEDLIVAGGLTTVVTNTAVLYGGSIGQLSQGVGFRNMLGTTSGLLLNTSTGLAGRSITVRLGDVWRILPFSESTSTINVAFVGDSVINGTLLRTASFDANLLEYVDPDGDVYMQWDRANNILYSNGAIIDEIRTS